MARRCALPARAFFAFAFPVPEGFENANLSPPTARWETDQREYVLDWDDVRVASHPHRAALDLGLSAIRHACVVCGWDPVLAASAQGFSRRSSEPKPPPRRHVG